MLRAISYSIDAFCCPDFGLPDESSGKHCGQGCPPDVYKRQGQACAVVHTAGHAIGYPAYDLTSLVYKLGIENCLEQIEYRKQSYIDKLFFWERHISDYLGPWADFL